MVFIKQLAAFFGLVFAVVFVAAYVTLASKGIYFKEFVKNNNGAIASALLAIVSIAAIALFIFLIPNNANAGTWFNDAGVYMGLDYTKKRSPQCENDDPVDTRGTSNLGAWGNIWQSDGGAIRVNFRYTHHSCFIGEDDKGYDGFGPQVEWKLWQRKR